MLSTSDGQSLMAGDGRVTIMRALIKKLIVGIGRRTLSPNAASRAVVLCYHSVHPTRPLASARPESFEQHLMWLKEYCVSVPFGSVLPEAGRERRDRPLVSITFDDGYADNHQYAFPLLCKYGVPATFFLTVGFLEHDPAVVDRFRCFSSGDPEGTRPLTWSQVREMRQAGMEFGAHTYSHPNLARLPAAAVEVELRRSKAIVEDRLGERVTLTAYPFGKPKRHFTAETMRIVSKVGYDCAAAILFRSVRARSCRYAVPRFYVTGDSLRTLQEKIFGAWDLLGLWHERAPAFLQR